MRRREFIALLGGTAAAWPGIAYAQRAAMKRVGVLMGGSESDSEFQARIKAFQQVLATLGWREESNIHIDVRWGSGEAFAKELISLSPNVILAQGSQNTEAFLHETRTIPIVFVGASDPLGSGLVASMAHPGGSLTGFTNYEFSMGAKWLELLKQVAPSITRLLVLWTPENIGNQGFLRAIKSAAPALGVQEVRTTVVPDIERVLGDFAREGNGGLLELPANGLEQRKLIAELTAQHRIPAIYDLRAFAVSGGMMSYNTDIVDLYRRAASYVDRIVRGERPGDLPVQVPTKF